MDGKDLLSVEAGNVPKVELNLRARVFEGLPGYIQAVDGSKYLNLKIVQPIAQMLKRDHFNPQPERPAPMAPAGGLNAPKNELANFVADSMYHELELLGENEPLKAIDECVFQLGKLAEIPELGGVDGAVRTINLVAPELEEVAKKHAGVPIEPRIILLEAITNCVAKHKFEKVSDVEEGLVRYYNSFVELLKQGDWWDRVLAAQRRLSPV